MTTGKVLQAITLLVALCTAIVANIGLLEGTVPPQVLSWLLFVTTILASALPSLLMTLNPEKSSRMLKGSTTNYVEGDQLTADQIVKQSGPRFPGGMSGMCVFLALGIVGCGVVKSASDEVSKICEGYLAAQPVVKVEAERKGVSPLVVAEAICLANDAGRAIWELFQVRASEPGKVGASPADQLEHAKNRALQVAREQKLITVVE